MSALVQMADRHGDRLICTGYALDTIADLLGCDGAEHHLNSDHLNGLHHAVKALGAFIKSVGFDLSEAAEREAAL
jgi:hypothetical protein